jgi:ketopantoate hydroxymethyltransferase
MLAGQWLRIASDVVPNFGSCSIWASCYRDLGPGIEAAIAAYAKDVRARAFPGPEHTYPMKKDR